MKAKITLCLLIFSYLTVFSQDKDIQAQTHYISAENYYNSGTRINAERSFYELEKAEKILGTTNSKILYLKIKSLNKLYPMTYFLSDLKTALVTFFKITDAKIFPADKYAEIIKVNEAYPNLNAEGAAYKKELAPEYKQTDSALLRKASLYHAWGYYEIVRIKYDSPERVVQSENNENYKYALSIYKGLADKNDIQALFQIASFYDGGKGVKKNDSESIEWYTKAANLGSLQAMLRLGSIYQFPLKDYKKAKDWFLKVSELGSIEGAKGMGDVYNDEGDYKMSLEWYTKASNGGSLTASSKLATMYIYGAFGVKKDGLKALELYSKIINSSTTEKYNREKYEAMNSIKDLYLNGAKGIEKNKDLAKDWQLKAEDYEKKAKEN